MAADDGVEFESELVAGWVQEPHTPVPAPAPAPAQSLAATPPRPPAQALDGLEGEVTLIVTTSVAPLNPLTDFIEDVIASYTLHEPSLRRCRKIIVCDWPLVREGLSKYRVGKVNADALAKYEQYLDKLRSLAAEGSADASHPFHRTEIMVMRQRQGFALAVGHALRATVTPFVMVVQHDRRLARAFGLPQAMAAFRSFAFRSVNYVCLATSSSGKNAELEVVRSGVEVRDHLLDMPGTDVRTVPMSFWLDSTHIARTDFYRDFTMQPQWISRRKWSSLKTGDFIEDKFGNIIRSKCREFGKSELDRVGTFLMVVRGDDALDYQYWTGAMHERGFYVDNEDFKKTEGGDRWKHVLVRHINQRKARTILAFYGHEYDKSCCPVHIV